MDKEFTKRIAARIRIARLAMGWSQKDVAQCLGLSCQQVCKYEAGRTISIARLGQMAGVLNCPLSFFFDDETGVPQDALIIGNWGSGRIALLQAYDKLRPAERRLLISLANCLTEASYPAGQAPSPKLHPSGPREPRAGRHRAAFDADQG